MDLNEMLDRYATLRDTMLGLKEEQEALAQHIKEALKRGARPETPLYRAKLRTTLRRTYPLAAFRDAFGDAATLEVASIDNKKAEALAQAGDLDAERLQAIAQVKEIHALHLLPKEQAEDL